MQAGDEAVRKRWSIFISYRRDDTEGYARFLHRLLLEWFDADDVYFDHQSNAFGSEFAASIREAIELQAKVVLVLVGKRWLGELIERAKTGEDDPVRFELNLALRRRREGGLIVIPVLTGNNPMPAVDARRKRTIPPEVVGLVQEFRAFHALTMFNDSVAVADSQFEQLLGTLTRTSGIPMPALKPTQAGSEPAFELGGHTVVQQFEDVAGTMDSLARHLMPGSDGDRVIWCTLSGMAGTGKTEVALQFSLTHRSAFTGGVWWFPGHDGAAFAAAVERACRACLIPLGPDTDVFIAWRQYLEQTKRSWLLVVDDVLGEDLAQRIAPRYGPHRVLVTTRNPGVENAIELTPWPQSRAIEFLRGRLNRKSATAGDDDAGLVEALGCLPLALTHAVAYLRATGLEVSHYRQQLEDVDAAPAWLASAVAGPARNPVLATIGSALRHCAPDAGRLLETLACFATEPVPESWLRPMMKDASRATRTALDEDIHWNELVAQLIALALVQRTSTYQPDMMLSTEQPLAVRDRLCLQLNRLTQQAILATVPPTHACRHLATRLISAAAQEEMLQPGRSAEYACLVPHLMFRAGLDESAEAAHLLLTTFQLHSRKGDLAAALECGRQWLNRCRGLFGPGDPVTLQAEIDCAETYAELGCASEALGHAHRVVEICECTPSLEPALRARSACVIARVAADKGDLEEALSIFSNDLVDRYILQAETPNVSEWLIRALAHMGATLSAAGRKKQALDTHQQLLDISQSVFGPWHEATLRAADAVATSMRNVGDLETGAGMMQQVMQGRLKLFGAHHRATIESQCALAEMLQELGYLQVAVKLFEQAWSAANLTLADDDPLHGRIERGLDLAHQAHIGAD